MKNKLISFFTLILVVFGSCGTVFATTDSAIKNEVVSEPSEIILDVPNTLTVDITENSVNAIAEAVTEVSEPSFLYEYQYYLDLDDGTTVVLDTNVNKLLDNYTVVVLKGYLSIYLCISDSENFSISKSGSNTSVHNFYRLSISRPYENVPFSFESVGSYISSSNFTSAYSIAFSNSHIYDRDTGDLLYESKYQPPVEYTISFVTGIDDLVIDPIKLYSGDKYSITQFVYSGKNFEGAYYDEDFTQPFVDGTEITGDLTLYLKWSEIDDTTILIQLLEQVTLLNNIMLFTLAVSGALLVLILLYRFIKIFF